MKASLFQSKVEIFSETIEGVVEKAIAHNQPGRVKCFGTYWPAKLHQPNCQIEIIAGSPVIVVGRQGITLLVLPT